MRKTPPGLVKYIRKLRKTHTLRELVEETQLTDKTILKYIPKGRMPGNSPRRSSSKIVADILKLTPEGILRTRLQYGANLSHGMLKKYLGRLLKSGLVELREDQKVWLTDKGKEWQKYNDKADGLIQPKSSEKTNEYKNSKGK